MARESGKGEDPKAILLVNTALRRVGAEKYHSRARVRLCQLSITKRDLDTNRYFLNGAFKGTTTSFGELARLTTDCAAECRPVLGPDCLQLYLLMGWKAVQLAISCAVNCHALHLLHAS